MKTIPKCKYTYSERDLRVIQELAFLYIILRKVYTRVTAGDCSWSKGRAAEIVKAVLTKHRHCITGRGTAEWTKEACLEKVTQRWFCHGHTSAWVSQVKQNI